MQCLYWFFCMGFGFESYMVFLYAGGLLKCTLIEKELLIGLKM